MRRLSVMFAIGLVALSACGKKEEAAGDKKASGPGKISQHECEIQLAKKPSGEPLTGQGTAEAEADAKEAAWKDVCGKLPAADQPNCRDNNKFMASTGIGAAQTNDKTTYTVTITLSPVQTMVTGTGKSDKDSDAACKAATDDACKKAGEPGDCLASGKWTQGGKSTSSATVDFSK